MELKTQIEEIGDQIKQYVDTRYELITLKSADKVSNIGSSIGMAVVIGIVAVFFLLFLSLATGYYLSMLLESYTYGFLVLSGIYLLILVILFAARKSALINPLKNMLIREMFEEKKKEKTNLN